MAYVEPTVFDAMHEITAREQTTIQAAVERLCRYYVSIGGALPDLSKG